MLSRRLVILFISDILGGIVFSRFHNIILSVIFFILFAVNVATFINLSQSDSEKEYRRVHPRAGAMRRIGYIWVFGLFMFFLVAGPEAQPWWATLLGLSLSGFLIWGTFRTAKKLEAPGL